ncbi:hypothetical protein RB1910 [Rhodopirellula baltica SH 1]|uniref:Uncharacterized protein n=1 Tax=Rhodopirellula baltica (strain DSM 10527 / NCIMB 13988 / SH1) TaxID=243090 RepID=Q7UWN1_RHOBA|nr:hypothetical protein RB1910 [Rhodopirellula baltica SH 1]
MVPTQVSEITTKRKPLEGFPSGTVPHRRGFATIHCISNRIGRFGDSHGSIHGIRCQRVVSDSKFAPASQKLATIQKRSKSEARIPCLLLLQSNASPGDAALSDLGWEPDGLCRRGFAAQHRAR